MWGEIGSAAIGALGGALGGGGGDKRVKSREMIAGHLGDDWRAITGGIGDLDPKQYYPGNTVAGLNPLIGMGLSGLAGYGEGMGGQIANAQFGAGLGGAASLGGGLDFINQYAAGGPNQFQFDTDTFESVYNNPAIQGMKDAATRDISRQLNWDTLPQLNQLGSAGGAQGSTRLGQAGALAAGMAADRMADVNSQIDMDAFNRAVNAGMTAGTQNLGSANTFGQNIMQGYGNFANIGLPQLGQAYSSGEQNLQNLMGAGEYFRDFDQSQIDASVDRWNYNQNLPYQTIEDQLALILAASPASGGVQFQDRGMSGMEGALLGAQAGLGLYGAGRDAGWWG